jgi:hypothetical protein
MSPPAVETGLPSDPRPDEALYWDPGRDPAAALDAAEGSDAADAADELDDWPPAREMA